MKRLFLFPIIILLVLAPPVFSQQEEVIGEGGRIDETIRTNVPQPEGSKVTLDERTGTLIITNTPTNLKKVEEIIRVVDKPPTQVLIETKFIEVSEAALEDIGIYWPNIDTNVLLGAVDFAVHRSDTFSAFLLDGLDMEVAGLWKADPLRCRLLLRALKQTGEADLLASPRVTTLNGQEAIVEVVKERTWVSVEADWEMATVDFNPDTFEQSPRYYWANVPSDLVREEYGVTLTVTPEIGERIITLSLNPEFKEYLGGDAYGFAQFGYREVTTRVLVEDGHTVIMGGLISEEDKVSRAKVPLLGDIPLLGKLFQRNITEKVRKNLLIFVTCHLLTPSGKKLVEVIER